MIRIIRNPKSKFVVQVQKFVKSFWFFGTMEWVFYNFEDPKLNYVEFDSYHEAVQGSLVKIELKLNLEYMDNHELRN